MPQEYAEMIAAHPCTENGSSPVTDLKNRRAIPGFVDAHMHPVMLADFRKKITAMPPEINSIEDLTAAIKERRETSGSRRVDRGLGIRRAGTS